MPQFNVSNYTGQIFWMLISFGILFLWVKYFIFPLFHTIFNTRTLVIQKHLNQAEKINKKAEKLAEDLQENHLLSEKKFSDTLAQARSVAQEEMRDTLDKNREQCNKTFKKTLSQLQTVEKTLSTAIDDWVQNLQDGFISKTKPGKGK